MFGRVCLVEAMKTLNHRCTQIGADNFAVPRRGEHGRNGSFCSPIATLEEGRIKSIVDRKPVGASDGGGLSGRSWLSGQSGSSLCCRGKSRVALGRGALGAGKGGRYTVAVIGGSELGF